MSQCVPHLIEGFRLLQCTEDLQARLNNICNSLRDMLSAADGNRFPRRGPRAIGVFNILDAVYELRLLKGSAIFCARILFHRSPWYRGEWWYLFETQKQLLLVLRHASQDRRMQ